MMTKELYDFKKMRLDEKRSQLLYSLSEAVSRQEWSWVSARAEDLLDLELDLDTLEWEWRRDKENEGDI